ncbi:unnamed protein product [Didymodactylos carnosus]|uniref:Uncharacterized protein n=1 Tax=Didymodactylos carnosus TaxID=1234261 RepID=A0A8S2CMA3_9BILA|nr:unnamed protein product [Didymodactylos carnosus]CAF3500323.1 unnamed protein product [Didymodactylos carnosus]
MNTPTLYPTMIVNEYEFSRKNRQLCYVPSGSCTYAASGLWFGFGAVPPGKYELTECKKDDKRNIYQCKCTEIHSEESDEKKEKKSHSHLHAAKYVIKEPERSLVSRIFPLRYRHAIVTPKTVDLFNGDRITVKK